MILQELIQDLEALFPPALAYSWDNVGLLAGSPNQDVKNVLVTLDVNSAVAQEAVQAGAELILSHHPILIGGVKTVRQDTETGKMLSILFENKIAVYAAHTNLDIAPAGINTYLAALFDLRDPVILADEQPGGAGLGRVGDLKAPVTLAEFAALCKEKLHTPAVRVSGDPGKKIQRVAIGSGGCGDYIPHAIRHGADVMLTADMKYHMAIDAVLDGIAVVDAGHYPTEIIAMDIFASVLKQYALSVHFSKQRDIFRFL